MKSDAPTIKFSRKLHCYRNLQRNKIIIKEMGGIIRNGLRRQGVKAVLQVLRLCSYAVLQLCGSAGFESKTARHARHARLA